MQERCPPKAKVVCSNHAGRAIKINDLRKKWREMREGQTHHKLTDKKQALACDRRSIGWIDAEL
jgi:hypothetical protein